MTIGQGLDEWNTKLKSEYMFGNSEHMYFNDSLQNPLTVFMKIITGQI